MRPALTRSTALTAVVLPALVLALTACGSSGTASAPASDTTASADPSTEANTAADSFDIADPWVKAATAEEGMTAVFGELLNGSDADVTVVAAGHEAAETVELHEVVTDGANATMSEKEGGFVIRAGSGYLLEPGADHIMLMGLGEDLEPGDETTVTVEFSDGSTVTFDAPVKEYAGAKEEYEGDHEHEDH